MLNSDYWTPCLLNLSEEMHRLKILTDDSGGAAINLSRLHGGPQNDMSLS